MKRALLVAFMLCSCMTACSKQDTPEAKVWLRAHETRLTATRTWQRCTRTLADGRLIPTTRCGTPDPPASQTCDNHIPDHRTAVRVLATQPQCLDDAIKALERLAPNSAGATVDLAAAYYTRAQRDDRAADLLKAWEASEQALAAAPNSLPQRFNRALIQEAAGLYEPAIASWDTYLKLDPSSEWSREAEEHRTRLARELNRDARAQWGRAEAQLRTALRTHDTAAIGRLIDRFPGYAHTYFERTLIPRYAEAPTPENLEAVNTFATALSKRSGDRYALDVVDATVANLTATRSALRALSDRDYQLAATAFERAKNPLLLRAIVGAARVAMKGQKDDALRLIDRAVRTARERGYTDVLVMLQSMRGYVLLLNSDLLDSVRAYDDALAQCARLRDFDGAARIHARRSGILRVLGRTEEAWRDSLNGMRYFARIVDPQERHHLLGAAADAASALNHPRFAMLHRNAAVELIQRELGATDPGDLNQIRTVQVHLAIARRARARTLLALNQFEQARRDLDEAFRLAQQQGDRDLGRIIQSRAEEVRGQALLNSDATAAAAAFTRALDHSRATEYHSFHAALFAQRAEAHRRAGRNVEAERDLRAALDALRAEETRVLERRRRGENDDVWSPYFARFRETYEVLVRYLAEQGRAQEAFEIAERARAFEPLNLILQLDDVPESFRSATRGGTAASRAAIQQSLPAGTLVLEYLILDDRSYTWLISRHQFELLQQPVRRKDAEAWQNALQVAVRDRDTRAFERVLADAHKALIEKPLAVARSSTKRLVFIPDGPMHGLPLGALINRSTKRFLLQDYTVAVSGSATLHLFALEQDRRRTSKTANILLIGDPAFDDQLVVARGMKRLQFAQNEVEELRALYGSRAELLAGDDATVPAVMSRAQHSSVMHVAAHGIINPQAPSQSLLLLAPSDKHNGALNANELLTQFKTDRTKLVVLAACSSAGGLPVGPEGVAPLVRPLIAAGVPAVIGSLWEVDDATAARLFVSFHRHYEQGEDAAVALQHAQLEMLGSKHAGLRSVFTWAPFQVVGHASSPFGPRQQSGGALHGLRTENSLQRDDGLHAQ